MKIILLRHGQPNMTAWTKRKALSVEDFSLWVEAYNGALLLALAQSESLIGATPDAALKELMISADLHMICGALKQPPDAVGNIACMNNKNLSVTLNSTHRVEFKR